MYTRLYNPTYAPLLPPSCVAATTRGHVAGNARFLASGAASTRAVASHCIAACQLHERTAGASRPNYRG
jgi:hypothetical protein